MKYELPEDLKTHRFFCEDKFNDVSLRSCKRNCPVNYRSCWEQHLRADLIQDCAIENEQNAESYVVCSKCGKHCDVGLAFNRYLCSACDNVEELDDEDRKALMGNDFLEIDEQELSEALSQIK